MSLDSFSPNLRALVIGSTGAIGAAFVRGIRAHRADAQVIELHRHSTPAIDFTNERSIEQASQALALQGPFHLIINATGILHGDNFMPEKSWRTWNTSI